MSLQSRTTITMARGFETITIIYIPYHIQKQAKPLALSVFRRKPIYLC